MSDFQSIRTTISDNKDELDRDYRRWLRSHSWGTDHVVAYKMPPSGETLSELIGREALVKWTAQDHLSYR